MTEDHKCQACGRTVEIPINLTWTICQDEAVISFLISYRVCSSCLNHFSVLVSDEWAREIAGTRLIGDPKGVKFPPLINNGQYYHSYKNVPFSKILQDQITVLQSRLEQQLLFEAESK
jgi:hypothetical protein